MSVRGVAAGAAIALAAALPAAAADSGQTRQVLIPGRTYAPASLEVLPGDTVVWSNADSTDHTVTGDSAPFDSGYVAPGTTFALTFTKLGRYAYHCTIHKFMHGVVTVVPVSLHGPGAPVAAGGRVVLRGLAPAGAGTVTVTVAHVAGARRVTPAGDGSFTVTVHAPRPEVVTAQVKGLSSRPVRIVVAPHVHAGIRDGRLTVAAAPARPGARIVVQRYVRERFAWRTVARGRLDGSSRAAVALPAGAAGRFRVVVRGGRGGWADGVSGALVRGR